MEEQIILFLFLDKVSLILAQNERLSHALHMQVER